MIADSQDDVGGKVDVLGDRVALTDQAVVDVSGVNGGGQVRIGGDYQGRNAEVNNASATFIGNGVEIKADATVAGDGGRIIVWADENTTYRGALSATGKGGNGAGGFAEVSGKKNLRFAGTADLSAETGDAGT